MAVLAAAGAGILTAAGVLTDDNTFPVQGVRWLYFAGTLLEVVVFSELVVEILYPRLEVRGRVPSSGRWREGQPDGCLAGCLAGQTWGCCALK